MTDVCRCEPACTTEIADHIDAAAALVEADGLHCGDFYPQLEEPRQWPAGTPPWTRGTPGCTLTALVVAQYPDLDRIDLEYIEHFEGDPVVTAFAAHLGLTEPSRIAGWSDENTAERVVAELRTCAANLRGTAA